MCSILCETKLKPIDVCSPNTDVLILLIDPAANGHLGIYTKLCVMTGKGAKYRAIDVHDQVTAIRLENSRCLVGLHHFTGTYSGEK